MSVERRPVAMSRPQALEKLLRHGPLAYRELHEITGWSKARLDRGLEVATAARGPVRRDLIEGEWRYRVATEEERRVPPLQRGVKAGSTWSHARRMAQVRRKVP